MLVADRCRPATYLTPHPFSQPNALSSDIDFYSAANLSLLARVHCYGVGPLQTLGILTGRRSGKRNVFTTPRHFHLSTFKRRELKVAHCTPGWGPSRASSRSEAFVRQLKLLSECKSSVHERLRSGRCLVTNVARDMK